MAIPRRAVIIVGGLAILGASYALLVITPTGKPSSQADNPECPHAWGWMPQSSAGLTLTKLPTEGGGPELAVLPGSEAGGDAGTVEMAALVENPDVPPDGFAVSGPKTDVPEFHDCQKLRVVDPNGAPGFGPLAAVFAKQHLDQITPDSLAAGVIVGMVYLPDGGEYPALNITKKFNCIAIRGGSGTLEGWIVGVDAESRCGLGFAGLVPAGTEALEVRRALQVGSSVRYSVPAVARWDWDDANNTQFIGIRCANAWCEIGKKGFGRSETYDVSALTSPLEKRNLSVKGWYDEQFLAVDVPGGDIAPSNIRGTVIPTAGAETFKGPDGKQGEWTTVAIVHTRATAGTYAETFHFVDGVEPPPKGDRVRLEMCRGTAWSCRPARFLALSPFACSSDANGVKWYSRIVRADGSTEYYCSIFRPHPHNFDIPAVARWRWRKNDETIWMSCPQGCCEVNADW